MATIIVNYSELHPGAIPSGLQGLIPQDQWAQICYSLNRSTARAHCFSCCGEILCCVFFAFPFIFLCHPCFYMAWHQGMASSEVQRLNQLLFGGSPVLGFSNSELVVNTALLQPMAYASRQASAYVSQPTSYLPNPTAATIVTNQNYANVAYASNSGYNEPDRSIAVAQPVTVTAQPYQPQQQRMLCVAVPPNANPGQSIPFAAPTGVIVQVTIPPGAVPGQQLVVYY